MKTTNAEGYAVGDWDRWAKGKKEDVAVHGGGACNNSSRLRKVVGEQVTTVAGSSEGRRADGAGAGARFKTPSRVALAERERVAGHGDELRGRIRVMEASLAPPAWMGPEDRAERRTERRWAEEDRHAALLQVLDAADPLQVGGLLKHSLEAFGRLMSETAVEALVWAD